MASTVFPLFHRIAEMVTAAIIAISKIAGIEITTIGYCLTCNGIFFTDTSSLQSKIKLFL